MFVLELWSISTCFIVHYIFNKKFNLIFSSDYGGRFISIEIISLYNELRLKPSKYASKHYLSQI
jgi:hypothetical protein